MATVVGHRFATTVLDRTDKNNHTYMTNFEKGFTLIELLVVIGIVLVLTGESLAYYSTFTQQKQLEAEAKKIADVLDLAKKKATASHIYTACDGGTDFAGYEVALLSSSKYQLNQCCSAGGSCTAKIVSNYEFQSNAISIKSLTGAILFKPLSQGIAPNSLGNPITLKTATGQCMDISISPAGLIDTSAVYTTGC